MQSVIHPVTVIETKVMASRTKIVLGFKRSWVMNKVFKILC